MTALHAIIQDGELPGELAVFASAGYTITLTCAKTKDFLDAKKAHESFISFDIAKCVLYSGKMMWYNVYILI